MLNCCFCFNLFRQRQNSNPEEIILEERIESVLTLEQAFQYARLGNIQILEPYTSAQMDSFYTLNRNQDNIPVQLADDRTTTIRQGVMKGYKIHVAIDDSDPNNIATGWNALLNVLLKYQIIATKVITTNTKQKLVDNREQRGKQITIYACFNYSTGVNWSEFCQTIEQVLVDAKITPAPFSNSDTPIKGSKYLSYRSDLGDKRYQFSFEPTADEKQGLRIIEQYFENTLSQVIVDYRSHQAHEFY